MRMIIPFGVCTRRTSISLLALQRHVGRRSISSPAKGNKPRDARTNDFGRTIEDEFQTIREQYETPKAPLVLAHGLAGFDELHLAGKRIAGIQYWRGIKEALTAKGIKIIATSVPAFGSIEERAQSLASQIAAEATGQRVNIIAGLDSRYMISSLRPKDFSVSSLTTIATPHHGSAFADFCFDSIGEKYVPRIYSAMKSLGMDTGAFGQLTRQYMNTVFNPNNPNVEGVRYFSYGATATPRIFSAFRQPHRIIQREEGSNDGLVSVDSSKWGTYKGTLMEVTHLELINWTNRLQWIIWQLSGQKRKFNAIALYLDIADMLAREGL